MNPREMINDMMARIEKYKAEHSFEESPTDFLNRIRNRNNPMTEADWDRWRNITLEGWASFIDPWDGRPYPSLRE
jgi:hypothetical protein